MNELMRYVLLHRLPEVQEGAADPLVPGAEGLQLDFPTTVGEQLDKLLQEEPGQAAALAAQVLATGDRRDPDIRRMAGLSRFVRSRRRLDVDALDRRVQADGRGDAAWRGRLDALTAGAADILAAARVLSPKARPAAVLATDALRGAGILRALGDGATDPASLRELARAHVDLTPSQSVRPRGGHRSASTRSFTSQDLQQDTLPDITGSHSQTIPEKSINRSSATGLGSVLVPYSGGWVRVADKTIEPLGGRSVPSTVGEVRVLGVGDLLLVRETLSRYEYAEIAHVENVMGSERRLRRHSLEETFAEETTTMVEESELLSTELETADRYELQEAVESVTSKEQSTNFGASVSAKYGPVQVGLDFGTSSSSSSQTSASSSSTYAREVVERAVTEVESRVRTRQVVRTRTVTHEENEHGFDNSSSQSHIVGVYRYLDKITTAQTYNYGARLFLETIVPEPASFLVHALSETTPEGLLLEEPPPLEELPEDVKKGNYLEIAARYGTGEVSPPPARDTRIAHTILVEPADAADYPTPKKGDDPDVSQPERAYRTGTDVISIPTDYAPVEIDLRASFGVHETDEEERIRIAISDEYVVLVNKSDSTSRHKSMTLDEEVTGDLPLAWAARHERGLAVTITVHCKRTDAAFQAWQMQTWSQIDAAYHARRQEYESQLSFAQSLATGVVPDSEEANRVTEQTELKRGVISMVTDQQFELFGSVSFPANEPPLMDTDEARVEGEYIRFFEGALEWRYMSYEFYHYGWAGRSRWVELVARSCTDTLHQEFLRAGAARVLVPVTPGFETAVLNYLETGAIWDGENQIALPDDHPHKAAIDALLAAPRDLEEVPVDEPWEVRVPTSLVILQASADPNDPGAL